MRLMMKPEHIHAIFDALEVGLEGADVTVVFERPPLVGNLMPETVRGTVTVEGTVYTITVERLNG